MRCSTSATRSSRACAIAPRRSRRAKSRFRSFTSLGSDWYWEQDAELRFTAISGNFAQVTGFSVEEHIGRACWDIPGVEAPDGGWDAPSRAPRVARDVLRRRPAPRASGARPDLRGDQRRAGVRCRGPLHRLSRHRTRSDAAEAGRGKRQPPRPLRHADLALQSRGVLRAARTRAVRRAPARATRSPCCSSTSTASRTSTTPSAISPATRC